MKRMIHFPKTRLAELAEEFGGVNRTDAIKGAQDELESMRQQADAVIGESLSALEALVAAPQDAAGFSPAQLTEILVRCDQIVTLAGSFAYQGLDTATRCLCDLADGLQQGGTMDMASIAVHVRTMRLLAPGSPPLGDVHQAMVLSELAKILTHHGFSRASDIADKASVRP